ncbi:MAG: NgoFVII family restriction endonuclease [Lachnospiraceae bacterium]|nr:NgoFVII family restriction endonuclease [Lachnospiraceae bacterium]
MINDGIYEQIVNEKLQKELNQLDLSKYDIDLDKIDADDARKILTIYISYILQKGMRYVRDNYGVSKEQDALVAQIRLCNEIIDDIEAATGEKDFQDLKILEKGEVLRSLYKKINSARSISNAKVVRPSTSLLESTLFTGSKQEPTMLSEIKKEIVSSDSVDLLISFIKWSAIVKIYADLKEFTEREGVKLRVISTTYMKSTDYKAILELAKLPNTEVKINYETNQMRMHAKSYIFRRNTGFSTAYIGSSNLSNPALTEGLEWNIKVTEKESVDIVRKCEERMLKVI